MSSDIEAREERNFQIFKKMSKNIYKDKRHEKWEPWKFEPKANFFMTANSRDLRFSKKEDPPTES